jgi:hypothetical protein
MRLLLNGFCNYNAKITVSQEKRQAVLCHQVEAMSNKLLKADDWWLELILT